MKPGNFAVLLAMTCATGGMFLPLPFACLCFGTGAGIVIGSFLQYCDDLESLDDKEDD